MLARLQIRAVRISKIRIKLCQALPSSDKLMTLKLNIQHNRTALSRCKLGRVVEL